MGKSKTESSLWVDLQGRPAPPPDYSSLPKPDDVLSGRREPDFAGLRLRSQNDFVCGYLHRAVDVWDRYMEYILPREY